MVIFYLLVISSHILQKLKILSVCLKEIFQRTHAGLGCFPLCIAPAHNWHWWALCFNRKGKMKCYFSLGSVKGNTIKNTCSLANIFFPFFSAVVSALVYICAWMSSFCLCALTEHKAHLSPEPREEGFWDMCHFILGGEWRFLWKMGSVSVVITADGVSPSRKGCCDAAGVGESGLMGPKLTVQV